MNVCATASRELAEPLAGTAATARTWLLIEQPGPWGAKALTSSHLDPAVGRALDKAAEGTGVRVALIRRPGRHADHHSASRRRVFAAHTAPGRSWIRTTALSFGDGSSGGGSRGPENLLGLDFAALGAGDHGGLWEAYEGDPLAFVCTNGKRDRCCALLGRPLAAELAAGVGAAAVQGGPERAGPEAVGRIWEVTHIGGHRFSPTLFVLPHGYAYGRASAHAVKEALEAARLGRIVTEGCRGRSTWDRPGQAADLAVRDLIGESRADALTVTAAEAVTGGPSPAWAVSVVHTDGRVWRVRIAQGAAQPPRPESCGAALGSPPRMDVVAVDEVAHSTS